MAVLFVYAWGRRFSSVASLSITATSNWMCILDVIMVDKLFLQEVLPANVDGIDPQRQKCRFRRKSHALAKKLLHPVMAILICIYVSRQLFLESFNVTLLYGIALALRTRNRLSLS
jgi:hypothetical protein